jgi:hypothetical protein
VSKEKHEDSRKKVEFKYVFKDDYNPVYANGAYGGISPKGEITINFFMERNPVPYSVTHELKEDGTIGDELKRDPERDHAMMIRFVTAGVVLNKSAARNIHEWLGKYLAILDAAEEKKDEGPREH